MGKKLPKKELLAEIDFELAKLRALIDDLRPRQMTGSPVTASGWTVKDIFGHLIGWQNLFQKWYHRGQEGKEVDLPDSGYSWKDTPLINQKIYKTYQKVGLKKVLAEFEENHQWTLQLIDSLNDKQLTRIGEFPWTGKSWTLSDYIRANTASHYRWASKHIRRWKKNL